MSEAYTTYYRSPIGVMAIVGGEEGITAIDFVAATHPNAKTPACLEECVRQLDEYFAHRRKSFDLKLNLRGTDFQKRVWRELLKIPFGKTVSYLDIAAALGDKQAIRAVGRANGQNPIVLIVPCHRVIGSDGALTGYGGGLWRKEWLLKFEGSRPQMSLFDER